MIETPDFAPYLQKLTDCRLLVVGDIMRDRFIYGDVARISPEAPVPVLSVTAMTEAAGGVGNVAANLAGLGVRATLVAVAGRDHARESLDRILASLPGIDAALVTDPARPTIQKDRYLAGAQHLLRVDDETTAPLAPQTESAVIDACLHAAKTAQAVIVSDYGKGVVTPALLAALVATGLPVYVDPKGRDYTRYRGAAVVTPNRRELAEALGGACAAVEMPGGAPVETDAQVAAAAQSLLQSAGVGAVLATRSADGMTLVTPGADPLHLRTRAREVFDVSGAGDTVIATLAAMCAAGASLPAAAMLSNIAAGLVVEKTGTAPVLIDDLRAALAQSAPATIAPVLTWEQARAGMERWRARGLSVGFTNGCFDILHQGHVTMLARARAQCDRLVLGLNCDASVARLKGPTRPVNDQDARARVVAALGSVDAVVLFGEGASEGDTPLDLITALRPDVIFKGADYTADTVIGADIVRAYGGRVALIPLEEGFSTTGTIRKMAAGSKDAA